MNPPPRTTAKLALLATNYRKVYGEIGGASRQAGMASASTFQAERRKIAAITAPTAMSGHAEQFGLKLDALPKAKMESAIRQALLKNDSIASQLDLSFAGTGQPRTIRIKLEIDVNPPAGSGEDATYLDFPADHEVRHQDLASNFALKIHALLCRGFLKGRDWYDFSWYLAKGTAPNLSLLRAALIQAGPWAGDKSSTVDMPWLKDALTVAIAKIEWKAAAEESGVAAPKRKSIAESAK